MNKLYSITPIYLLLILLLFPLLSFSQNNTISDFPSSTSLHEKGTLLFQKGMDHFHKDEMGEALECLTKSLQLAEEQSFVRLEFDNKVGLGKVNYWQSNYQVAAHFLNDALSNYPSVITKKDSSDINFQLGYVHLYSGNLDMALQKRLESLNLYNESGDSIFIADGLYAIAEVLFEKKEYEEALIKVTKALSINNNMDRLEQSGFCYDLMANIFHATQQFEKSLQLRELACDAKHAQNTSYNISYCAQKKAKTFVQLGGFAEAKELFETAMDIQLKAGLKEEYTISCMGIGELYMAQGDCKPALRILEKCLSEAKAIGVQPLLLKVYQNLFNSYSQCGKFEKAFLFQEKFYALQNSIMDEKMAMNIANLSTQHELEQKGKELAIIQRDNKLNSLNNALLSALIFLLLMLGSLIYFLWKKQVSHNKILAAKNQEVNIHYEELKQSNQKLQTANQDLEQFAYITSHDLKAPLRTIGGYASLIKRRYAHLFDSDGLEYLEFISGDIKHMHQLLDDILAYSRINKNELTLRPVELDQVVASVTRLLHSNIENKGAVIKSAELPVVSGNSTQLLQIFQNLIENALKFIPPDRQPVITIRATANDGYQQIEVADNGIGIDESYHDKIFTMFKRLHTKQDYEGTGIGLTICKKIIEGHGGKIWIKSDGKSGTTFLFTLKEAALARQEERVMV